MAPVERKMAKDEFTVSWSLRTALIVSLLKLSEQFLCLPVSSAENMLRVDHSSFAKNVSSQTVGVWIFGHFKFLVFPLKLLKCKLKMQMEMLSTFLMSLRLSPPSLCPGV